jgi:DNA-binding NarL/FixJ family response regulator
MNAPECHASGDAAPAAPRTALADALEVLVVDDDPAARRLLDQVLGAAGWRVRAAPDGVQALEAIDVARPDAVLLDVRMPGLDGFETCQRLRTRDPDLPVIFMTGLGETEHVVRGFAAGANDYVTKPVSGPEVIARLLAHTRTARLVRAARDAVASTGLAMLGLDDERLLWANDAARALLGDVGLVTPLDTDRPLPPPLSALHALPAGSAALAVAMPGARVVARRVSEPGPGGAVFALELDASPALAPPPPEGTLPRLTARESEVLLWVARGKTNRDIADILGMSPRTVNKHLEHVFEKLGVETRTAAAAAARRLRIG